MGDTNTGLGSVLIIMAGGAIGLFVTVALAVSPSIDHVSSPAYVLDEDGTLSLRDEVTGTRVMSVDPGCSGSGNPRFVLEQEGATLTGLYTGEMGTRLEVHGTVEDGRVELVFDSSRGEIRYEGALEGTRMKGTCDYAELGEGTFAGRFLSS